jgi:hypothetical protein
VAGDSSVTDKIGLETVYLPSDDVVAREIEGELILVPIAAGVGDIDDAIFTFNEVGSEIWRRLDGVRTLRQIATELASLYDAPSATIEADLIGLVAELQRRKMLVKR